jgi:hypothetical protein
MQAGDQKRFLEVLAGVHDFYSKDMSEFAAKVWLQACDGFELEQATKALSAHLMDPERGAFMPKPADLVRALHGTQTDRALIAWGKVLMASQRVGAYTSVCFDDGLIHAVVEDLGGWVRLCQSTNDELPHLQRRFCDSYRAYARQPAVDYPARLSGVAELQNGMAGHRIEPPTLIGDPAKAERVRLDGTTKAKTQITGPVAVLRLTA